MFPAGSTLFKQNNKKPTPEIQPGNYRVDRFVLVPGKDLEQVLEHIFGHVKEVIW